MVAWSLELWARDFFLSVLNTGRLGGRDTSRLAHSQLRFEWDALGGPGPMDHLRCSLKPWLPGTPPPEQSTPPPPWPLAPTPLH